MIFIISLLVIWRLADFVVSVIAPRFIPYLGFFSYPEMMNQYHMPFFLQALTNFDGIFYIKIGLNGYGDTEQAYFPLYPICIRLLTPLVNHNPIIAGVIISSVTFIGGLFLLYFLLKKIKHTNIRWFFIFLLTYPTSYYFNVMYTESLFLLVFIGTLYFFKKGNILLAIIFGFLTAITRVTGVIIAVPLGILLFEKITIHKQFQLLTIVKQEWKNSIVVLAPLFGLASYCYYLWRTSPSPFYFFYAQENFGAHRSTHLIFPPQVLYRYFKIFTTAQFNFQYFVAVLELVFYVFVLTILIIDFMRIIKAKKMNYFRLGINLFSVITILLPSLTGTLTAVPRYSLLSISVFFFLSDIKNTLLKYAIVVVFFILHIIMFSFFIQGYYVT